MTNLEVSDSTVQEDVEFIGQLNIKNTKRLVIKGIITGEIRSDGDVLLDEIGRIHANINVRNLVIKGRIETDQDIVVNGLLTMEKGGVLIAKNIYCRDIVQLGGSKIKGMLIPFEGDVDEEERSHTTPLESHVNTSVLSSEAVASSEESPLKEVKPGLSSLPMGNLSPFPSSVIPRSSPSLAIELPVISDVADSVAVKPTTKLQEHEAANGFERDESEGGGVVDAAQPMPTYADRLVAQIPPRPSVDSSSDDMDEAPQPLSSINDLPFRRFS